MEWETRTPLDVQGTSEVHSHFFAHNVGLAKRPLVNDKIVGRSWNVGEAGVSEVEQS